MRQAIRDALKARGRARAPEIARDLEQRGVANDGKTRFSTRVYNDLWRMSQNGVIRYEKGEFFWKD